MNAPLVLSLFPGIGLLDRAFEEEGFCVVRGPDLLWGGDVRTFHPPAGKFDGVIGGPPCQAFSKIRHIAKARGQKADWPNLIPEYERCIEETQPRWFVMENVPDAPEPDIDDYVVRCYIANNRHFGGVQSRTRRISFGTSEGRRLPFDVELFEPLEYMPAVTSANGGNEKYGVHTHGYSVPDAAKYQGLPEDFLSDAPFTKHGKLKCIANGVPLPMGRAIARAVKRAMGYDR